MDQRATGRVPAANRIARLRVVISAHALLRIASGANAILIGLYLAHLNNGGTSESVGLVGTLSAMSFAAELVASLPMGMASDALNPRWIMTAGGLLGAFAALLFGLTRSPSIFFLSRTLEGLAAAAIVPALLAYLTFETERDGRLRARVMSYFELTLLAGLAFGGMAGAVLFRGLQAGAFQIIALVYCVCAALLFAGARAPRSLSIPNPIAGLKRDWQIPGLRRLAPVWLCVNAIIGLWLGPTFTFLLTRRSTGGQYIEGLFRNDAGKVGELLLGYSIVFGAGVFIWSFILPRIRLRTAMTITLSTMLPVCALLYLVNHLPAEAVALRWTVIALTCLGVMIESGFTPAALAWVAGSLPADSGRGAAMGIYSVLLSLGAILGSLLGGILGQRFAVDGLLYGTVLVASAALALLHWVPNEKN